MQPWRRSLIEHGLTLAWAAFLTGKSVSTVRAYSCGARRAPVEWVAAIERLISDHDKGRAA